jgi:aspartyl aminopeptidase
VCLSSVAIESGEKMAAASGIALELVEFLNAAPTPFHAVEEAKKRLSEAGFVQISERHPWNVEAGGKYFFTRNHSTIIAFAIGNKCASNPCLLLFCLVTSHTHIHFLAKLPEPQLVQYLSGCKSFAWVLGFRVA